MNELLDICCDASNPDGWAKSKIVETKLRKLGVPTKDVQERKMALFSARLGLDYGGVNGIREALENPSHPRENTCVIAAADWDHGQQAARFR